MKIAMIGQKLIPATYGGIERHVEELGSRLVDMGHEVTVYCRRYYTQIRGEYKGMRLLVLPSFRTKHLDTATHCGLSVAHAMTKDFDIIHFHALGPSMYAVLPRLAGIRSVVTVHGLDWQREKWGIIATEVLKRCEYSSLYFPSKTIVVSRALRTYFRNKYGQIPTYIPNGTNIPKPKPAREIKKFGLKEKEYVLYVGRLVPEKGCHYLLDAYRQLDTDKELVIAGGTSFSDEYVNRLKRMADDKVRFLGYVYGDTLDELYSNSYLFVLPSDVEGLPIALLEAMSFGNCSLVSDIPENVEVIGSCGVTFQRSQTEDLKNKLGALLDDSQRVDSIGQRAKRHVLQTYDWDGVAKHVDALYYSVLRGF